MIFWLEENLVDPNNENREKDELCDFIRSLTIMILLMLSMCLGGFKTADLLKVMKNNVKIKIYKYKYKYKYKNKYKVKYKYRLR